MLFVPTYKTSFIENGLKANADALILDFEDSVPHTFREVARRNVQSYIEQGKLKEQKIFIRLNSIESTELFKDLSVVINEDINGFMLTKVRNSDEISYYDRLIKQLELDNGIDVGHFKFIPLIETAEAVMNSFTIAKQSSRNIALAFGGEDFLDDIYGTRGESSSVFDFPRAKISLAARASGILPIDTPYLSLKDLNGFVVEKNLSYEFGFAGSLLIHPCQIEIANDVFSPKLEEVERAKEIMIAIKKSGEKGSGVAMLGSTMVGPPMQKRAMKILEFVEQYKQLSGNDYV